MLQYTGYAGHVEFDDETGISYGEVLDLQDVVTFQGKSVKAMERAFRESIDDYLEFCAERHEEPDKPFSGRLMMRLPADVRRKAYVSARREGKSVNEVDCGNAGKG